MTTESSSGSSRYTQPNTGSIWDRRLWNKNYNFPKRRYFVKSPCIYTNKNIQVRIIILSPFWANALESYRTGNEQVLLKAAQVALQFAQFKTFIWIVARSKRNFSNFCRSLRLGGHQEMFFILLLKLVISNYSRIFENASILRYSFLIHSFSWYSRCLHQLANWKVLQWPFPQLLPIHSNDLSSCYLTL